MELVCSVSTFEYSKIIKAVFGSDECSGRETIRKRKKKNDIKVRVISI